MILKLTQLDSEENLESGKTVLVNLDDVSTIHASKITRKGAAIIGQKNETIGSVVAMRNGNRFPIKELADDIYDKLPWPLTRNTSQLEEEVPTSHA